jgi:cytoskeletal protein CcmA (bactofilin family)
MALATSRKGPPGEMDPSKSQSLPVLVGAGTVFEGVLGCRAGARIDGTLKGEIAADGRIELGEESRVTGTIEADEIAVAGHFEGSLIARKKIEFLATARVQADLATAELVAEEGCRVEGNCRTGSSQT